MAEQDFYGSYTVQTASGTDFGLGTEVRIEKTGEQGVLDVSFVNANGSTTQPAHYQAETDSLRLPLEGSSKAEAMFISRYVDRAVDPPSDYRAIYGIVVLYPVEDEPLQSPVWSAKLDQATGGGVPSAGGPALSAQDFAGSYTVRTTANSQFGRDSTIEVGPPDADGVSTFEIVNGLGDSVQTPPTVTYQADTVTMVGSLGDEEGNPTVTVSIAIAPRTNAAGEEVKHLYGTFVIGDPQQAGTYGGDDEGGGGFVIPR